jgi:hypothetical protein
LSAHRTSLSEPAIRTELLALLWRERGNETLLLEEVGLLHGSYRADVVVLDDELSAYEIKSAADTLVRLPHQARAYGAIFDYVTVVATANHLAGVLDLVPEWWGVILASDRGDATSLMTLRLPELNPSPDVRALASLLWKDEAARLLSDVPGAADRPPRTRSAAYDALSAAFTWAELRQKVTETLRLRSDWLPAYSPASCGD